MDSYIYLVLGAGVIAMLFSFWKTSWINKQDQGTERMKKHGAFKVLAFLGDASGDFPKEDSILSFSKGMYMFPNPMYGKW